MAKILQVIDVDSEGHKVRLDDGRVIRMPHGGDHPQLGEEFKEPSNAVDAERLAESRQESEHAEEAPAVVGDSEQRHTTDGQ